MQVPDEIRKCVAFLCCRKKSGFEPRGTVFFVGYPISDDGNTILTYAITARHVIEELTKLSNDGYVHCRLNTNQGEIDHVQISLSDWQFNDDSKIDVAITSVSIQSNKHDHKCIPLTMFITPEIISQQELGIGDDLFFPGLFSQRPGKEKNLPIVRIGNIAGMPEEPIETSWGILRPAYLVEARSIGGLSGSPVFWHPGSSRTISGTTNFTNGSIFYLLGLVHGHYIDRGCAGDISEPTITDGLIHKATNMGIAIVVPASDIFATLNHPLLDNNRRLMKYHHSLPEATVIQEPASDFITQEDAVQRTDTRE